MANRYPTADSYPTRPGRRLARATAIGLVLTLGLAGCGSLGEGAGNPIGNLIAFGTTTPPEPAPPPVDEVDCPVVVISDGGAALRVGGAEASSVRHQLSINNVARECQPTGGGGYTMKIGVEGLALLGPAGTGTRSLSAPIRFIVRRGDEIIADRSRQIAVTIPAGQSQASFTALEEGIVVTPGPEPRVEVGLGTGPARPAARRPRG